MRRIAALPLAAAAALGLVTARLAAQRATGLPSTAIVLALPDSGGYLINDQPIAWTGLPAQLVAIYGPRPAEGRVLVVGAVSPARRDDLAYVEAVARKAGVRVERRSIEAR